MVPMLKYAVGRWTTSKLSSSSNFMLLPLVFSSSINSTTFNRSTFACISSAFNTKLASNSCTVSPNYSIVCSARRRVRHDDEEEEEEYGYNAEIAMLEYYSQSVKEEALLVRAQVDDQEVELLIFKGFSSSLSQSTCPDPSRSIVPARAVIKSIDRIKGPFNPSNIEYIDKGLSWDTFKTQLP